MTDAQSTELAKWLAENVLRIGYTYKANGRMSFDPRHSMNDAMLLLRAPHVHHWHLEQSECTVFMLTKRKDIDYEVFTARGTGRDTAIEERTGMAIMKAVAMAHGCPMLK